MLNYSALVAYQETFINAERARDQVSANMKKRSSARRALPRIVHIISIGMEDKPSSVMLVLHSAVVSVRIKLVLAVHFLLCNNTNHMAVKEDEGGGRGGV